ncbi:MAG TPA: type II secretion system protein GspK [Candidatus Competibacter sp.]|nr:type II secretion system protein GspK [Candidatus Competibacter sp.]
MSDIPNYPRDRGAQRGMVLIIVLWIVTLLAVMAGGFAYSMRVETRLATGAVERARARALAEAGVAFGLAWQLDQEASRKYWPPNGDLHEWTFGGGRLQIRITNANGLVSLNTADPDLLKALFAGTGASSHELDRLVEAVLDWRESDRQGVPGGVHRAGGRMARGWLGSTKGRFESIEELQQIEGVTREVYERIADGVTAFSNHVGVNPELAPAGLLRALGLDERTVADYVSARVRAAADGSPPPPLPRNDGHAFFLGGRTNTYHVTVAAEVETGTVVVVKSVADVQGMLSGQNLRLVAWREGR